MFVKHFETKTVRKLSIKSQDKLTLFIVPVLRAVVPTL